MQRLSFVLTLAWFCSFTSSWSTESTAASWDNTTGVIYLGRRTGLLVAYESFNWQENHRSLVSTTSFTSHRPISAPATVWESDLVFPVLQHSPGVKSEPSSSFCFVCWHHWGEKPHLRRDKRGMYRPRALASIHHHQVKTPSDVTLRIFNARQPQVSDMKPKALTARRPCHTSSSGTSGRRNTADDVSQSSHHYWSPAKLITLGVVWMWDFTERLPVAKAEK